jgi:nucleoid DNA-binding protein
MTVTKKEIIIHIANETKIKQINVKKVLQHSLDYIIKSLAAGKRIELRNFGVFKVKSRQSRIGRNPRTGEPVSVPPRRVVVFKPGLNMKRDIK